MISIYEEPRLPPETSTQVILVAETPIPVETPANGVVLPVGPGHADESAYHADPYIVGLALAATPCYGNYSNRSQTCEACTVKGRCINAMAASLTTLAASLREQDKKLEEIRARQEAAKAKAAAAGTPVPASKPDPMNDIVEEMLGNSSGTKPFSLNGRKVETIKVMAASKCMRCGGSIALGEKACWIPPNEGGESGSLHEACAKEG